MSRISSSRLLMSVVIICLLLLIGSALRNPLEVSGATPCNTSATIRPISVAPDGTPANGASYASVSSADGRYVAFESYATNLVTGDTSERANVFVYDTQT